MTPKQTLTHLETRSHHHAGQLDGLASQMRDPLRTLLNGMAFEMRRDAEIAAYAARDDVQPERLPERASVRRRRGLFRMIADERECV